MRSLYDHYARLTMDFDSLRFSLLYRRSRIVSSRERWSASNGLQPIDTTLPELSATRETPLAHVHKRSFTPDIRNCKKAPAPCHSSDTRVFPPKTKPPCPRYRNCARRAVWKSWRSKHLAAVAPGQFWRVCWISCTLAIRSSWFGSTALPVHFLTSWRS